MFAISLSSCSRYNANFKLDQSVLAIHDSPLYYEISEDDHPFVSPGVNSRAELVPSHGASRRWLGDDANVRCMAKYQDVGHLVKYIKFTLEISIYKIHLII
jgi:hypothetical protein